MSSVVVPLSLTAALATDAPADDAALATTPMIGPAPAMMATTRAPRRAGSRIWSYPRCNTLFGRTTFDRFRDGNAEPRTTMGQGSLRR
jgi:hypothetical protein